MLSNPGWMLPGQEHVQQHAEPINVTCGCNRATRNLLRRRILRGKCRPSFPRQQGRRSSLSFTFQQLGNAKIQKLYLATLADKDVRRLNVAMHDEVGVCVSDRRQHVEE